MDCCLQNYRCYLCQFTAVSLQQSVSPNCLFTLLETEWKAAWECAPFIDQGIQDLSESFWFVVSTQLFTRLFMVCGSDKLL